jgi:hypothetical protein
MISIIAEPEVIMRKKEIIKVLKRLETELENHLYHRYHPTEDGINSMKLQIILHRGTINQKIIDVPLRKIIDLILDHLQLQIEETQPIKSEIILVDKPQKKWEK